MPNQKEKPHHGNDLLNACYFGNTNDALKLLAIGADVHYVDSRDGWAGIHYAARWGRTKIIAALMQAGVSINLRTTGKENALHKACRSNRKDTIIWMLMNGADPNMLNGNGEKPADLTLCDTCKYICHHFEEFLSRWQAMGKVTTPIKQNKKTVSKNSCDVAYDIDWDVMSKDIAVAQEVALAMTKTQRLSPMKTSQKSNISSPPKGMTNRATDEIKRLRFTRKQSTSTPPVASRSMSPRK